MQSRKPSGLMQHAQYKRRQCVADPWYGAQSIRRMKFAVEPFDFAAETTELAFQQAHAIDLDGGFQLQVFKIDCIPMKASRLHCSRFEAVYQLVGKRAAMGMVTAGVLGNEAEQGRTPCFDDGHGIQQVVQDGQRQIGTKIWQNSLDGGAGPAHQIDQPTLDGADLVFQALTLAGQTLQRMAIGVGHIDRVNWHPTEPGDGTEHIGVSSIGFGVLPK